MKAIQDIQYPNILAATPVSMQYNCDSHKMNGGIPLS